MALKTPDRELKIITDYIMDRKVVYYPIGELRKYFKEFLDINNADFSLITEIVEAADTPFMNLTIKIFNPETKEVLREVTVSSAITPSMREKAMQFSKTRTFLEKTALYILLHLSTPEEETDDVNVEKIQKSKPYNPEERPKVINTNDPASEKQINLIKKLTKSDNPEIQSILEFHLMTADVEKIEQLNKGEASALIDDLFKYVHNRPEE